MARPTRDFEGDYIEAGEAANPYRPFSAGAVAAAFEVDRERVLRAMRGEFGLDSNGLVDSKMAQQLAEVLLGDEPLDLREAALMRLGAYTPRSDATWGLGSGPSDEESDRQSAEAGVPPDEVASKRSSHDPATQSSE